MPDEARLHDYEFKPTGLPTEAYSYLRYMAMGLTKARAKQAVRRAKDVTVLVSSKYQVNVTSFEAPSLFGSGKWLSCKRLDKDVITSRQVLRDVLHAVAPEHYGLELFPREERVVDMANQYHLWCFAGPCPFLLGSVADWEDRDAGVRRARLDYSLDSGFPDMVVLEIRTRSGELEHDWRRLQSAKERLMPGREAVMLHTSLGSPNGFEGRLLCLSAADAQFPFGFAEGSRLGAEDAAAFNARQRSF